MRQRIICAALGAAAISLLAACSSGPGTAAPSPAKSTTPSSAESGAPSPASTASAAAKFPVRKDGSLVAVALRKLPGLPAAALVDGFGRALYTFDADQGGKSVCNGACTKVWQPAKAFSTDAASGGARQDLVGKITRDDGSGQLAYNGHPLYYYLGTKGGGDNDTSAANGVGGGWWTLDGNGNPVMTS